MKLALMQPYFFPYLGYFSLIKHTDRFVFFDTPQYIRRGWMNRNRILNSNGEVAYITVPLKKAPQQTAIKDMLIDDSQDWVASMLARFGHYKKEAPFYRETIAFLEEILGKKFSSLSELNIATTIAVCRYLGIADHFDTLSEMDLTLGPIEASDEWGLEVTKAMQYEVYVNPPGGMTFYDREKYRENGVELQFLKARLEPYEQHIGRFESGLSIIDVLMFNPVDRVREMLDSFDLL